MLECKSLMQKSVEKKNLLCYQLSKLKNMKAIKQNKTTILSFLRTQYLFDRAVMQLRNVGGLLVLYYVHISVFEYLLTVFISLYCNNNKNNIVAF